MRRLDVYSSWFLDEIMQQGKQFTLLVTPSEDVKPLYRDNPPPCVFDRNPFFVT
jgi:hypothetical protein